MSCTCIVAKGGRVRLCIPVTMHDVSATCPTCGCSNLGSIRKSLGMRAQGGWFMFHEPPSFGSTSDSVAPHNGRWRVGKVYSRPGYQQDVIRLKPPCRRLSYATSRTQSSRDRPKETGKHVGFIPGQLVYPVVLGAPCRGRSCWGGDDDLPSRSGRAIRSASRMPK
jgi:hypothetical protein